MPKRVQKPPKSSQKPAKRRPSPKLLQTPLKKSLARSKTGLEHDFGGELCSTGFRSDIVLFFVLRATCAICLKHRKNLGKTVVFAHQELLRTASARARGSMKKLRKISRWSLQNPPRSVLELSQIDHGALQDGKKPTRTENERSKNAKCG